MQRAAASLEHVAGGARRTLENGLKDAGDQLERCEARLAAVERELGDLDCIEIESSWVAECLTDFDQIWDVLTADNRGRLLRTVIQRVEVDEPANKVHVHIADLGADALVAPAGVAVQDVAP